VDLTEPLALKLSDFCRAIRTGETPTSSATVGIDVVRIVEAVDRSLAVNGRPVRTPSTKVAEIAG
jgi:hypothetical protein